MQKRNLLYRLYFLFFETIKSTSKPGGVFHQNPTACWSRFISKFKDKQKAYDFERYLKSGSGGAFRNKLLIKPQATSPDTGF